MMWRKYFVGSLDYENYYSVCEYDVSLVIQVNVSEKWIVSYSCINIETMLLSYYSGQILDLA